MGKWFQNKSFSTEKQKQGIKARKGHRGINARKIHRDIKARKMHRAFGVLLAAALVFQAVPFEGIAVSASESSGGGLCEHHRSHTPDCGYKEAEPGHECTHEHTEDCYRTVEGEDGSATKEPDCHHEHDESCGYREAAEGSPCTFVCEICSGGTDGTPEDNTEDNEINDGDSENPGTENGDEVKEPDDGQEECTCEERCTEDSINTDCPVCGAEDASLSDCKGKGVEDSTEDAEENTKQPEDTGICKHHQEHDDACGYQPESEDSEGSSCTYECRICPIEDLIAALPDKVTEDNVEDVRGQLDEILALFGELTEDEQEQIDLSRCYELQEALDGANDPNPITESVEYQEASWDGSQVTYESKTETCTLVENSTEAIEWTAGWYAVSGTVTISEPVTVSGDVRLILTDGCTLNASQGIVVTTGNSLTIYAQSGGSGILNATGTTDGDKNASAGIGGGTSSLDSGSITIHGGEINAAGGYGKNMGGSGAGIGGGGSGSIDGDGGNSGAITIFDGVITAVGGELDYVNQIAACNSGAGIGGGSSFQSSGGAGNSITIYGGTVTAKSQASYNGGAGIGGGAGDKNGGAGNNIQIHGGTVNATGGDKGAGIGGGSGNKSGDGTVQISGGKVTAVGGSNAAGIGGGGGYKVEFNGTVISNVTGGTGSVTISGGIVDAKGGAGNDEGDYAGAPIGSGGNASGGSVEKTTGIVFENGVGTVCGDVTFNGSWEVPAGYKLNITAGNSLSGSGTLSGGGKFTTENLTEDMISVPTDLYYNGQDRTEEIAGKVAIDGGITLCGQTFMVSGWTVEVVKTDALTYTATYMNDNNNANTFTKTITLRKSGTKFEGGVQTYKGSMQTDTFTANDTITVKATPEATGAAPKKAARLLGGYVAPTAGQMAVFVSDTQVSEAVKAGAEGSYAMTVSAVDVLRQGQKGQDGKYTLLVRFLENDSMARAEATAKVTVIPNPLTADMVTLSAASVTYNGAEQKPTITVSGLTEGTDYDITYSSQDFTNAGTVQITVTGKGSYAGTVKKIFTIKKATPVVAWSADEVTLTYTGQPANIKPTVTLVNKESFNGTIRYKYGDYSGSVLPTDAGTYQIKAVIAEQGNYEAAESGLLTLYIDKADAPTITYPAAVSITYGQKLSDSALTGGSTEYGTFAWDNGSTVPTVGNTGYTVVFTANEKTKKNYKEITDVTKKVTVQVRKAVPAVSITATVSGSKDNRQATLTVNVAKAGAGAFPTGTVTFKDCTGGTEVTIGTATLSSGCASYTWDGLQDQTYTVKAVYTGDNNYTEAESRELTFDAAKQNQQDFALDTIGTKTYGDAAITLKTVGGSGSGVVRYESSDEDVIRIEDGRAVIVGAGTATITAIKAGDNNYNEASATRNVMVAKKALTVRADSKTVVRGKPMPAFTYRADGLVNGDAFTTAPSITAGAQDTDTLGKYDIVISGGTLRNSESYRITYINGILNIVERFYTVTVTDGTGGGEYAEGDTVTVTANERNGYTFTGWSSEGGVAFADSKAKTTTFAMPAKSVTVKANYTRNGSGENTGGNSGGSGNKGSGGNSADNGYNGGQDSGGGGSTNPGDGNAAPQIPVIPPVANTNPKSEAAPGTGTTPVNPGIGNTARPGAGLGGNTGISVQGAKQPFIKGEDGKIGWDVIRAEEEKAQEGNTINVDMNGSTVVPGDIFDSIKGKDITITFDMGNGILWSVDGKSITTDKAGDIDFSVKTGVKTVPVDIINNVTGESYSIQIRLAYEGEFGFTAVLSIDLGRENAGLTASLYYYDESAGELEFICQDLITEDGTASLAFTHASDYVIAIEGGGRWRCGACTAGECRAGSRERNGAGQWRYTGKPGHRADRRGMVDSCGSPAGSRHRRRCVRGSEEERGKLK